MKNDGQFSCADLIKAPWSSFLEEDTRVLLPDSVRSGFILTGCRCSESRTVICTEKVDRYHYCEKFSWYSACSFANKRGTVTKLGKARYISEPTDLPEICCSFFLSPLPILSLVTKPQEVTSTASDGLGWRSAPISHLQWTTLITTTGYNGQEVMSQFQSAFLYWLPYGYSDHWWLKSCKTDTTIWDAESTGYSGQGLIHHGVDHPHRYIGKCCECNYGQKVESGQYQAFLCPIEIIIVHHRLQISVECLSVFGLLTLILP